MRDLERARFAFERVAAVPGPDREAYRSRVMSLGANIIRSGLAAAATFLERDMRKGDTSEARAAGAILGQLGAGLPGLGPAAAESVPATVRAMDVRTYMLATREALRLCVWLKRATQAGWDH